MCDRVYRISYIERSYTLLIETTVMQGNNRLTLSSLVGNLEDAKKIVKALNLDPSWIELI